MLFRSALQEILDEAQERRKCAADNYNLMKETAARRNRSALVECDDSSRLLDVEHIVRLVQMYPTTNEETHFACVMDPKEGRVVWCRRWVKPISQAWIREHWSPTSTW